MKTSVGKTKLELASGDITELEVDAIANTATTELSMGAGVAGAIKRVGGEAIEKRPCCRGPSRSATPSPRRATTSRLAG